MQFKFSKPKAVKLKTADLVETSFFPALKCPLIISPAMEGIELGQWIVGQKEYLDEQLVKFGAVLFRGFGIVETELFEKVVKSYDNELLAYKERSTPRTSIGDKVYTATEYPADQQIPLHNENSYSHQFPLKLWFCCIKTAESDGETPLADSREVFKLLSENTKNEFIEKQVMYVRNFKKGIDLDWRTAFQTDSKEEVEKYCRDAKIEYSWTPNDELQTRQIRPAIITHPLTQETSWFNQAHLFHVSSLEKNLREDLLATTEEKLLTRNAYFGDGGEIPEKTLDEIRQAFERCKFMFGWEKGDVLLVDNILTAHGRNHYSGQRKILVAMSEKYSSA